MRKDTNKLWVFGRQWSLIHAADYW